jgi:hypothetical protein
MKRTLTTMPLAAFLMLMFLAMMTTTAQAGVLSAIKARITGDVAALVLTAALAVIGGAMGVLFARVAATFREVGEFLLTLGDAMEDNRITRDEISELLRDGGDIFRVWR